MQYGPGVSALAVYMTQYQLLPYQRSADLLEELAGIAISPASLHSAVTQATRRLAAPVQAIRQALVRAPVAHADETGLRVGGALHWLHVLSTATLTAYFAHPKRGGEALSAFGLLEQFSGTLVHDHWSAYDRHTGAHGFCNAHHLRELIGLEEAFPNQGWASRMIDFLCEAKAAADQARAQGLAALPPCDLEAFRHRFEAILDHGERVNPARTNPTGQRGRIKQSPAHNLIARLRRRRDDVLRFLADLRVPFDNNQAERDVRMPKLKQKVSGGFRSDGRRRGLRHHPFLPLHPTQTIRQHLPVLGHDLPGQPADASAGVEPPRYLNSYAGGMITAGLGRAQVACATRRRETATTAPAGRRRTRVRLRQGVPVGYGLEGGSSQAGGPRAELMRGGSAGSLMWLRIRSTGAASAMKATMRLSAPPFGQTSGRDSNRRASSMAHRSRAGERELGAAAAGGEAVWLVAGRD